MTKKVFRIYADGGARGNPGPAAIGFIVKDPMGKTFGEKGKYIGRTTNNVAEYTAVFEALSWVDKNLSRFPDGSKLIFFLDSKLVVNQLNGFYKIKNTKLRELIVKVRQLERGVGREIVYQQIPREKNLVADRILNRVLRKQTS